MNSGLLAGVPIQRIILIRPCCIGDVVLATAALTATRSAFPQAHISFAVGNWSREVLEGHPDINELVDTGSSDLPTNSLSGLFRFVQQLREGRYDLAVSLVRSATMSLAVLLSGIPIRAGIHSGYRGFGYQYRTVIQPSNSRHESEIYLDVVSALGINTEGYLPNIPLQEKSATTLKMKLELRGIRPPYFVIHPGGGENPGMSFASKRWPLEKFITLANRLEKRWQARPIWLAGANEAAYVIPLTNKNQHAEHLFIGELNFAEISQLASRAIIYIGNDSGLSHLVAASNARVATIFGPSDPSRYAPLGPRALALYRPSSSKPSTKLGANENKWNWDLDGISVEEVASAILAWVSPEK